MSALAGPDVSSPGRRSTVGARLDADLEGGQRQRQAFGGKLTRSNQERVQLVDLDGESSPRRWRGLRAAVHRMRNNERLQDVVHVRSRLPLVRPLAREHAVQSDVRKLVVLAPCGEHRPAAWAGGSWRERNGQ